MDIGVLEDAGDMLWVGDGEGEGDAEDSGSDDCALLTEILIDGKYGSDNSLCSIDGMGAEGS